MIIQLLNLGLIGANLLFMLLALIPLKQAMKAKYKFRYKFAALCLIGIFATNSYYLINANY